MIYYIYDRLHTFFPTVIATSNLPSDDILIHPDYQTIRGSADSVIDRLLQAGIEYRSKYVFRVTADNPCTDPEMMQSMYMLISNASQINGQEEIFPNGLASI